MNTSNYFYWNEVLSKEEIKNINSLLDKHKKEKEPTFAKARESKKTSTVYPIKIKFLKEKLNKILYNITLVNQDRYGYDLYDFHDDDEFNYNIYKKDEEYEWHTDGETFKASDIKLTALINISEKPFSGGEFNLLNSKNVTLASELSNPGSMIVFNSFILHKVDPITKGTRKTLTFFGKGPAFK